VRQYSVDVDALFLETDISDQAVFVAADIENRQFSNFVDHVEGWFHFSSVTEPVFLNHPSPSL
jgi:hypothetical protein